MNQKDELTPMTSTLPSTSAFPAEVSQLEREALESVYLDLRSSYRGLMVSRGQFRGQAQRSRAAMSQLEGKLRSIAEREASVRAEAYEMLEIVTGVIGELEDAGDDLVTQFEAYRSGRRTYQGGNFLGNLMKAVIEFITRWTRSKEKLETLIEKQQSIQARLKESDGKDL